jgi:hypothetical protein
VGLFFVKNEAQVRALQAKKGAKSGRRAQLDAAADFSGKGRCSGPNGHEAAKQSFSDKQALSKGAWLAGWAPSGHGIPPE